MSPDEIFFPFRKCTVAEAVVPFRNAQLQKQLFLSGNAVAEAVVPFRKCTVAEAVVPFRKCTVAEAVEVSMSTIRPTEGTLNFE